ncbi:hypothetical protein HPP92_013145 [Vanilla planifolia]|uniref:phenylalanine--tRNA ligase n=1 Tax=Vanilla planifolia TaxID=51239 RepID=A0A835UUJ1_VANPL|nr:hypothetical protein HPP92_013145 [Vanilla planifolia]
MGYFESKFETLCYLKHEFENLMPPRVFGILLPFSSLWCGSSIPRFFRARVAMPTVSVGRDRFFQILGRSYTQQEFEDLCFEFGVELDDVTTEKEIIRKETHVEAEGGGEGEEKVIYKIEVAANRKRSIVAIGTHDLDTIEGPFTYEALKPQDITFVPLKQAKSFRADELVEFYRSDLKLKKFLHIIENSPVYPVIYDRYRTVLSLPPIINGAHSAISLKTKNVFIECTATDLTKAKIVLNTMVTMFSEYCDTKFEVEPVKVVYPDYRQTEDCASEGPFKGQNIYPDLAVTVLDIPLSSITSPIGISLGAVEVIPLLNKMQLQAEEKSNAGNSIITVRVPPTRSDILHPCDVMEDVAIAYGYNKVPKKQNLNVSRAGYMEVLTWLLCSHDENFAMVNRTENGEKAVTIGNPRSSEFEVVRTSLMSGLLKTVKHNIDHKRPIKIFEAGDVVVLDERCDVGALNNRRLAALYCNVTSGFEEILRLVTRIMQVVQKQHEPALDNFIKPSNEPEFFPNRQCHIFYYDRQIGVFGVVHPEVLEKFGIPDPCSFVEIDIQALL